MRRVPIVGAPRPGAPWLHPTAGSAAAAASFPQLAAGGDAAAGPAAAGR